VRSKSAWVSWICIILNPVGDEMNSGYLTLVVLITICILLGSGWKVYLLKGITSQAILIFIVGWLFSSIFTVQMNFNFMEIQLNLAFIFLLVSSGYLMTRLGSLAERLQLLLVAFLLCAADYVLREASGLSIINISILLALMAVCLQKNPLNQITSLIIGFLCGNVLSLWTHHRSQAFVLADQPFQDLWWFTLLLSRILAGLYEQCIIHLRKLCTGFFEKNK
jgi:hypothetical protein